ncbi:MAG TPA: hypothetical protein VM077_05165 [Candidatus Limnocylindrales bacterium]|nr:hypothetical protein [Candidatus Limnocylindrales bacterium]
MVETPNYTDESVREKTILEIRLRQKACEVAAGEEYGGIPDKLKKTSVDVAIAVLLIPRRELFNEIERLDEEAVRTLQNSAAHYDKEQNRPLLDHRSKKVDNIGKRNLNEYHRSILLTRFDRMLIASRWSRINLAKHYRGRRYSTVFKKPEFQAAHKLCLNIIKTNFQFLPISEQRNPNLQHPSAEKRDVRRT